VRLGLRRAVGGVMAVAMLANTACYSFVPMASGAAPAAAQQVRVVFTAEGTAAMTSTLGPRVVWADGTLSERRPDGTIVVGVSQVRLQDGMDHFWSGTGMATIAPSHVQELQHRRLDKGRTRTALVVLAVALVGIASLALGTGGADGSPDAGVVIPPP
jgi:hypothetical protein